MVLDTISPYLTVFLLQLTIPLILGGAWAIKNRKRIPDLWRLRFRRKTVVKVNFLLRTGRNEERFVVPDHEGIMKINQGRYLFVKEFSVLNARYRIPEITMVENQIHPPENTIGETPAVEMEVEVPGKSGVVKMVKRQVPGYVVSYKRTVPQQLNGLWAHQVAEFADSGIIHDITTATARVLKILEYTLYGVIALLVIVVLGGFVFYGKMDDIKDLIQLSLGGMNRGP